MATENRDQRLAPEVIEMVRRQMKNGNALAMEAARRRGIKLHPRIAAARAAAAEKDESQ